MEIYNFPAIIENLGIDLLTLNQREKIELIEYIMSKHFVNIADEMPPKHYLLNGVYTRELFIPAGTLLTGKIHTTAHQSIMLYGDISVMTEDGMKRINEPCIITSMSGMKRAGYTHADTVWITIHATDLTDIEQIEAALFHDSDLSWVENKLAIGH